MNHPVTIGAAVLLAIAGSGSKPDRRGVGPISAAQYVRIDHVGDQDKPIDTLIVVTDEQDSPATPAPAVRYFVASQLAFSGLVGLVAGSATTFRGVDRRWPDTGTFQVRWREGKAEGQYVVPAGDACWYLQATRNAWADDPKAPLGAALELTMARIGCPAPDQSQELPMLSKDEVCSLALRVAHQRIVPTHEVSVVDQPCTKDTAGFAGKILVDVVVVQDTAKATTQRPLVHGESCGDREILVGCDAGVGSGTCSADRATNQHWKLALVLRQVGPLLVRGEANVLPYQVRKRRLPPGQSSGVMSPCATSAGTYAKRGGIWEQIKIR